LLLFLYLFVFLLSANWTDSSFGELAIDPVRFDYDSAHEDNHEDD